METTKKKPNLLQLNDLRCFGDKVNKFGANFAVFDTDNDLVLLKQCRCFESDEKSIVDASLLVVEEKNSENYNLADEHGSVVKDRYFGVVLKHGNVTAGTALIDFGEMPAKECEYLSEMLRLFIENYHLNSKTSEQIGIISTELAQSYEELMLLHKLSTSMRITEEDVSLQMACDSLTEIVSVEGIAILLEKFIDDEKQLVLAAGSGLIEIDGDMGEQLYERLVDEIRSGKDALVDSEVDSPFKYKWPKSVRSIIAVPLCGSGQNKTIMGLMVAVNIKNKEDFDCPDIKLFNSVASSCAVFVENGKLFADLKELFIGSMKALIRSIDAKDRYTHGHSERVAFISRWLAMRYAESKALSQEQIHKIYLAGLLHDIGKIGIDEAVLRKKGKLTDSERDNIRRHPATGANILSEIRQMQDIVPGILCHHERADGKGYPNGLLGDEMPLMGKIISVADSFDAMTSKRVYRDALSLDVTIEEIEKNLGSQFDEEVGRIFLNSDIRSLWHTLQNEFSEIHSGENLPEYGILAVGMLIE